MHVCDWAAAAGYESVSLTTFRDVSWNMAFDAQLGFKAVRHAELSPALRAIVDDERRRGPRFVTSRRDAKTMCRR
jgi:hypothetical protein